jgi:HTH-type transcriptional regulator, transcriptional repressor of NAD biosynthesis genes
MFKQSNIFKVCLYGSESTGKTTLAKQLAAHYDTVFVPEMARWVLGDRKCELADFPAIAYAQFAETERQTLNAKRVLFCDTDLIVTQVYEEQYFDYVHPEVLDLQRLEHYDLYLFCDTDIPWVADEQRELGHLREEMKLKFLAQLQARHIDFQWIRGNWEQRFATAAALVDRLLLA